MNALGLVVSHKIFENCILKIYFLTLCPTKATNQNLLNNFGRGPPRDRSCRIWSNSHKRFKRRSCLNFSLHNYILHITSIKLWLPGRGQFWPQGHNLNNFGREHLDNAFFYALWWNKFIFHCLSIIFTTVKNKIVIPVSPRRWPCFVPRHTWINTTFIKLGTNNININTSWHYCFPRFKIFWLF